VLIPGMNDSEIFSLLNDENLRSSCCNSSYLLRIDEEFE
jgi:hypothetical protein